MADQTKKFLAAAYYFPPMGMGGVQRIVKLAKFLPDFHWHPHIITVKPVNYYAEDQTLLNEIEDVSVTRTGSLDPLRISRILSAVLRPQRADAGSTKGGFVKRLCVRTVSALSIPDSKIGWLPFALYSAHARLQEGDFRIIFTTSPPLTAHLVGLHLHKKHGIPWVADFRDHWLPEHPEKKRFDGKDRMLTHITRSIVTKASALTAVSEPITASLASLLPDRDRKDFYTIPNGFDPDDFPPAVHKPNPLFTIVYCGTLGRMADPEQFFRAAALAVTRQPLLREQLRVHFVGKAVDLDLHRQIEEHGLEGMIILHGYLPHKEALRVLAAADLLLFMLSPEFSKGMVTGKIFEYLASRKPVLAFTGRCAAENILRGYPGSRVFSFRETQLAAEAILEHYEQWRRGEVNLYTHPLIEQYSRYNQAKTTAGIFESLDRRESEI